MNAGLRSHLSHLLQFIRCVKNSHFTNKYQRKDITKRNRTFCKLIGITFINTLRKWSCFLIWSNFRGTNFFVLCRLYVWNLPTYHVITVKKQNNYSFIFNSRIFWVQHLVWRRSNVVLLTLVIFYNHLMFKMSTYFSAIIKTSHVNFVFQQATFNTTDLFFFF